MTARDLVLRYALFALPATGVNVVLAGIAEELGDSVPPDC